jgi:hypothetical protein
MYMNIKASVVGELKYLAKFVVLDTKSIHH